MKRTTPTYYNAENIPVNELECIIKSIHKHGFGTPAISSTDMYCWIAKEHARRMINPYPHLARLVCTYEKRNPSSVYSVSHCKPVDEILHKYFKLYSTPDEDYWYMKYTTIKSIKNWLGDDMRGTMENPIY